MVWEDLRLRQSSFSLGELGGEESSDEHSGVSEVPLLAARC